MRYCTDPKKWKENMRYLVVHLRFPDAAIHVIIFSLHVIGGYKHIIKKIRFMNVSGAVHRIYVNFVNVIWQCQYYTPLSDKVERNSWTEWIWNDIAPTNISLWTVPGLKWFVVDKGKFNKQKCVQRCAKLFLCIPFGTKFGMASGI